MIGVGPIVCGGGWKSRKHCRIQLWGIGLFLLTLIAALSLSDRFGVWGLLVPLSAFVVPLILFRFNRFRTWLGVPDDKLPSPDQTAFSRPNSFRSKSAVVDASEARPAQLA